SNVYGGLARQGSEIWRVITGIPGESTNSVLGRRSASDHKYGSKLHQACSPDLNVAFDSLMPRWPGLEARPGSTRPHCLKPCELSVSRKKLRKGPRIQSTI